MPKPYRTIRNFFISWGGRLLWLAEGAAISRPLYVACAVFFGAYLSYYMVPLVGHGTAKHAVELARKSRDPMLQKSAADRIALLSGAGTPRDD